MISSWGQPMRGRTRRRAGWIGGERGGRGLSSRILLVSTISREGCRAWYWFEDARRDGVARLLSGRGRTLPIKIAKPSSLYPSVIMMRRASSKTINLSISPFETWLVVNPANSHQSLIVAGAGQPNHCTSRKRTTTQLCRRTHRIASLHFY